jgi:hypothetical protein
MNVAETMRKAIPEIKKGIDDIRFYVRPELEENWTENYAIVEGFYYDYPDSDYFEHDRFRSDMENKVKAMFPGCKVTFYWESQEIEVQKLPTKEQEAALQELSDEGQEWETKNERTVKWDKEQTKHLRKRLGD